jgi:hypothetical protein
VGRWWPAGAGRYADRKRRIARHLGQLLDAPAIGNQIIPPASTAMNWRFGRPWWPGSGQPSDVAVQVGLQVLAESGVAAASAVGEPGLVVPRRFVSDINGFARYDQVVI